MLQSQPALPTFAAGAKSRWRRTGGVRTKPTLTLSTAAAEVHLKRPILEGFTLGYGECFKIEHQFQIRLKSLLGLKSGGVDARKIPLLLNALIIGKGLRDLVYPSGKPTRKLFLPTF